MDWSAIAGLASSMFGEQAAGKLTAQQQQILKDMYEELRNTPLPELQNIQAEQMGPSAMEQLQIDPADRQRLLDIFGELQDTYRQGGMNIQDKAALNDILNSAATSGRHARERIAGDMAARGQLDGGAKLAMQLASASDQATQANRRGLDVAAQAERRRMDLLSSMTGLGSDLRRDDWSEAAQRAAAHDATERWNAAAREKAQYYNAGLPQQQFANRVTKSTGQQAAGNNLAGFYSGEAQGVRNQYANYGRAGAEAVRGFQNNRGGGNSSGGGGGFGGGGYGGGPINSDDPNDVYARGTDYGSSDPDEWENPYK